MTLTIGSTDITPYIAFGGIKWQRNDIDAPETGRALDGLMYRGRITTKMRLDITCRPLTASELQTIMTLIQPEYVTVTYYDPMLGLRSNIEMYSNNHPASYLISKPLKTNPVTYVEYWTGITFPLIER